MLNYFLYTREYTTSHSELHEANKITFLLLQFSTHTHTHTQHDQSHPLQLKPHTHTFIMAEAHDYTSSPLKHFKHTARWTDEK